MFDPVHIFHLFSAVKKSRCDILYVVEQIFFT